MNGLRFKVGELALISVSHPQWAGRRCEVVEYAEPETGYHYRVKVEGDELRRLAWDYQLQKLDPPAEPKTMTVVEEVEV